MLQCLMHDFNMLLIRNAEIADFMQMVFVCCALNGKTYSRQTNIQYLPLSKCFKNKKLGVTISNKKSAKKLG